MNCLFSRRAVGSIGLGTPIAAFAAISAQASIDTSQRTTPAHSQPFLYAGDSHCHDPRMH
jgi:hypothetical protein